VGKGQQAFDPQVGYRIVAELLKPDMLSLIHHLKEPAGME
jgi:hypothetical protein